MGAITEFLRCINDPAGSLTRLLSVIKEEPDHAPRPLASPAPSGDTPPTHPPGRCNPGRRRLCQRPPQTIFR